MYDSEDINFILQDEEVDLIDVDYTDGDDDYMYDDEE